MVDKTLILNQIKNHLSLSTDKDFANYLDIKPTTLSMWYKRNMFDIDTVFTKCDFVNADWLLTGEGEMLKENILAPGDTIPKGAIPYWDLPVSAGHSVVDVIGSKDPVGYIKNLPGIEMTEAILPITGMSMEPEISNGAIIGVRKIDNWETLNTERIYLIITHDDRMIKRIEYDNEDPAILWCLSPNYAKFKIYKNDIIEVQRVCFVFNPK